MKRIIYLLLLLPVLASAQLKINEIMPNNVSYEMDDAYNYSMWVEVYNAGASTENLSNYVFAKKMTADATLWTPKSANLAPGAFAVLYFEREDQAGHATFKLDPEGGSLFLTKGGTLVDELTYPQQYRNVSYGRVTDGSNDWTFFAEPSKGTSNNGKKSGATALAAPQFDKPAGFYEGSVSVSLSAANGTVYYTRDGSEPTAGSTPYSSPISLVGNTVIRAIAIADGSLPSSVATSTYFVYLPGEHVPDLPIVSISTDERYLFDDVIGIYTVGTNGDKRYYDGYLENGNKKVICDNVANYNQPWDRPVHFELFVDGALQLSQELDIAISGQCSRGNDPKSLKINPRKKFGSNTLDYDFFSSKPGHKYESVMLRAGGTERDSWMRDGLTQTVTIGYMNQDYQAYQPAVHFINGEYYGINNIRERTNKNFVYSNYGLTEDEIILLEMYELVYTVKNGELMEMVNFVRNNDMGDDNNLQLASEMLDLENFMDYIYIQLYGGNWDWPHNNIKIWKKKDGGKWRFILYDLDFTFDYMPGIRESNLRTLSNGNDLSNPPGNIIKDLFNKFLENEAFKQRFISRFCRTLPLLSRRAGSTIS